MSPLNQNEIRIKSLSFWLLFIVLLFFALLPVYFMVWTAGEQQKTSIAKEQEYREMYNKQITLSDKIDSLYTQLTYVSAAKVNNYLYVEDMISNNKLEIQLLIGKDSAGKFATYAHLVNNLNPALFLKDSIVRIENSENMLRNDLLTCMSKNKRIRQTIFEKTKITDN